MMRFLQATNRTARAAAVAIALGMSSLAAHAQQPSPAALATAKEIVAASGSTTLFAPLVAGVVEQGKLLLLQQNQNLSKVLSEVADQIRTDMAPRIDEIGNEVGRLYATRFTEPELKELLAFYKSPLGKKMITEQPKIAEASLRFAQNWANALSDEVIAKMRAELQKRGHPL
jgi:hypothetical protein